MADAFSYKLTTENELFTFEFSQVLGVSETLSTATCTIVVKDGADGNPSSMLVGSAAISGTKASQRLSGGVDNVTYRVIMTVTTSAGNTFVGVADLPVYAPTTV